MPYDSTTRRYTPDFGSDVQVPQAPNFQMPQAPQQQNGAFKDAFMNRLTQPAAQPQIVPQLGPAGAAEAGPEASGGVMGKLGSAVSAGAKAAGIGKIAASL